MSTEIVEESTVDSTSHEEELVLVLAKGTLVSIGQIWGIENVVSSILICISILLFSPLLLIVCVIGAFLGSAFGK